jgi:DNA N-6-adenine-methyltransferase Dam
LNIAALSVSVASLEALEAVIERGLETFVEVGSALMKIRDGKHYRQRGFKTFDAYCLNRWGWGRTRAHRLIEASEVASVLLPIGNIPGNEGQARELVPLLKEGGPEAVRETWDQIREEHGDSVTAEKVRRAVHFSSASPEWYTPPEIVERVLLVLGTPDVDPCSDGKTIPARTHFTQSDDGLSRDWSGTVYMNPPYGRGIDDWIEKLRCEYVAGRVVAAIALVPARVDTEWFRKFQDFPVCFISGRLKFSGHDNSAPFPSAAVYLGIDRDRFYAAFSTIGVIWTAVGGNSGRCLKCGASPENDRKAAILNGVQL